MKYLVTLNARILEYDREVEVVFDTATERGALTQAVQEYSGLWDTDNPGGAPPDGWEGLADDVPVDEAVTRYLNGTDGLEWWAGDFLYRIRGIQPCPPNHGDVSRLKIAEVLAEADANYNREIVRSAILTIAAELEVTLD